MGAAVGDWVPGGLGQCRVYSMVLCIWKVKGKTQTSKAIFVNKKLCLHDSFTECLNLKTRVKGEPVILIHLYVTKLHITEIDGRLVNSGVAPVKGPTWWSATRKVLWAQPKPSSNTRTSFSIKTNLKIRVYCTDRPTKDKDFTWVV